MTAKKKLLILNGSHSEISLIESAKKLGFYVITTGNDPSLIGHKCADEYHCEDYSDKEAILHLSIKLDIDAICSCANDFGIITASYVAEKMGLPGHDTYDTTLLLHHKDQLKQFSIQHDLPVPYAVCFNDKDTALTEVENVSFPVIIKPIDLTGGKGVEKVNNKSEYSEGIEKAFKASIKKRIVVEDFFVGTQHSFSSFLVKKKVVFSFSDNEYSYLNPYYVSTSAAPANNIERYLSTLVDTIEKMALKLNLVDGVFHIQYLANGDKAKIIDITRRCSGDLYPYPVNQSTGIDWSEWIVKSEAGLDCSGFPDINQSGFYGRHCIMSDTNGTVKSVQVSDEIKKYIYHELYWWKDGDVIDDYLTQKVGMVFLEYNSKEEMLSVTKQLSNLIKVELYRR